MLRSPFPPLALADWKETRDTLHGYAQVLGQIRRALMPPQKHWWHISLHTSAIGLTTTPLPAGDRTLDLTLDFTAHELTLTTSRGDWWDVPLEGQSANELCESVLDLLDVIGARPGEDQIDRSRFDDQIGAYDEGAIETYWHALSQIDLLLKQFKGQLRRETSPVQLWPHHFDLSLVWFSGRLVPDVDPDDAEYADEQMAFGFSTGDAGIPDPYFYVTAYPQPEGFTDASLPAGATWHTGGWQGALLPYAALTNTDNAKDLLLTYWHAAHTAGARLMTNGDTP